MQNPTTTALYLSFVITAMSITTGSLGAQSAQNESIGVKRQALVSALTHVDHATRIRVSHESKQTEGTFRQATESTVVVSNDNGGDAAIRINAIDGVWVEKRSSAQGALIGGSMGAIALGALGALFVSGLCESPSGCTGEAVKATLALGAMGGAGGIVIGGALGLLVKRWVRIAP